MSQYIYCDNNTLCRCLNARVTLDGTQKEDSHLAINTMTCSASFATVRENNAKAGPNAMKAQPKKTIRVILAYLSQKGRIFCQEKL